MQQPPEHPQPGPLGHFPDLHGVQPPLKHVTRLSRAIPASEAGFGENWEDGYGISVILLKVFRGKKAGNAITDRRGHCDGDIEVGEQYTRKGKDQDVGMCM